MSVPVDLVARIDECNRLVGVCLATALEQRTRIEELERRLDIVTRRTQGLVQL